MTNECFKSLPEEMKQEAYEAAQSGKYALKYTRHLPLKEQYYLFPILPKFTWPPGREHLWICVQCEHATTSVTRMFVHTIRDAIRRLSFRLR